MVRGVLIGIKAVQNKEINKEFLRDFYENPKWYGEAMEAYYKHEITLTVPLEGFREIELPLKPYLYQWCEDFEPELNEMLIASFLNQEIGHDHIGYFFHESSQCFADKAREENDSLVKSYKNSVKQFRIIDAHFRGGTQGEDGCISVENNRGELKHFPLEVGYCPASQVYYHLRRHRCVARLPYNSNYIVYFELNDEFRYQPREDI